MVRSLAFLVAALALGCAAQRPPVGDPVQVGACRVQVLETAPAAGFTVVARVSADLRDTADARAAVEELAAAACGYGANALLPLGAEPLLPPLREHVDIEFGGPIRVLDAPQIDEKWRRERALAIRLP